MYGEDRWDESPQIDVDSGPIAIGRIMPAVLARYGLTGDEPEVIANYDRANGEFPHESTGDLFFDDAQFEAYRRLGGHMIRSALRKSAACRVELPPAP